MQLNIDIANIINFPIEEKEKFEKTVEVFDRHSAANGVKDRYYEGKIPLREVNLGIALPEGYSRLEIGCAWGAKTVDVLAGLSVFDGFVGTSGTEVEELDKIVVGNRLIAEYEKACRDELKYGCTFATLSADPDIGCKIRFHSPKSGAAVWNGEKGRIDYGFAVIDTKKDNFDNTWTPSIINFYTDDAIWVLHKGQDNIWRAQYHKHKMARPLMEPLVWNATSDKPFGRSRIKEPIRRLIQGYVRTMANATIGLEFSTAPQKYILGITDEQYESVVNSKFKQYIGNILAATTNPDNGEKPSFGQLPQGNIDPHIAMLRALATQFSAATGLPITDTGVINDANPTSSEAILAQSKTLTTMAEQLNKTNGDSLRMIALMATAIKNDISLSSLSDEQKDVIAHFKNPAMPSISVTGDWATKVSASDPDFPKTDVFWEMQGLDQADIRRIKAQETRIRGMRVVEEIENEDTGESMG